MCVHEFTSLLGTDTFCFSNNWNRSEISIRSTSPIFVWMALPQNSRVFAVCGGTVRRKRNSDPPNPIDDTVDGSEIPRPTTRDMYKTYKTQSKKRDFNYQTSTGFSRHARFLRHQQYSHPLPHNQPLAKRFKTCIGSEAFRKGLCLASRRSRLSDAVKKGCV